MDKATEIRLLTLLKEENTYFKVAISDSQFEGMVENIKNDHPLFLGEFVTYQRHRRELEALQEKITNMENMALSYEKTIKNDARAIEVLVNRNKNLTPKSTGFKPRLRLRLSNL